MPEATYMQVTGTACDVSSVAEPHPGVKPRPFPSPPTPLGRGFLFSPGNFLGV